MRSNLFKPAYTTYQRRTGLLRSSGQWVWKAGTRRRKQLLFWVRNWNALVCMRSHMSICRSSAWTCLPRHWETILLTCVYQCKNDPSCHWGATNKQNRLWIPFSIIYCQSLKYSQSSTWLLGRRLAKIREVPRLTSPCLGAGPEGHANDWVLSTKNTYFRSYLPLCLMKHSGKHA